MAEYAYGRLDIDVCAEYGLGLEAVRYKCEPGAMNDMLSGRWQIMNGTATSMLPRVNANSLRALSTSERWPQQAGIEPE